MKKDWFALGLILIIAGLVFLSFSNTVVNQSSYTSKAYVDNIQLMNLGKSPQVSISAYFSVSQHFYFNFTKGRFWGSVYDRYEDAIMNFAPNASIERYKTVSFNIYTPSGDVVSSQVYMVAGVSAFAVVYFNQSTDFVPLVGGNLTPTKAYMEGTIERDGNYTFTATAIDPYVVHLNATDLYDVVAHGIIGADPPSQIALYKIDTSAKKPYFAAFLVAGVSLVIVGVAPFLWASRSKKKHPHKRLAKANSWYSAVVLE